MAEVKSPLIRERDYWYDNIKAFLIITVVLGHFASGGTGGGFGLETNYLLIFKKFIYVFHMPVFMMVTGRFSKSRINNNDWPKVISKVIVPYLIAQTLMLLVCSFMKDAIMAKNFSYLNPMYGMWYMLNAGVYTMFTARFKDKKWLFPVSLVAALLVGFGFSILYGGFHRIVCYYPFFLFGYYTANVKFDFCKKPWFRVLAGLAFIAMAVYIFYRGKYVQYNLLSMNKTYWSIARATHSTAYKVCFYAVGRYIMAFVSFFMILGIMPTKKTFFSHLGKYSIYIYVLHLYIVIVLRDLDSQYKLLKHIDKTWEIVVFLLATVVLSFILVSKPVRKVAQPFLEPKFDLSRVVKKLAGTDENKD